MNYNLERLDDDPAYAPGIGKSKQHFYWRPSKTLVKAGYHKQAIKLDGEAGDSRDMERAAKCRDLTRQMLRWASGDDTPRLVNGTWLWLIARYKSDEFSPFKEVKANTREGYLHSLARWEAGIGAVKIADTDLVALKRWQQAMQKSERSVAYIKRAFTMLRIVTGYGVAIKAPGARDVRDILGELRIKSPRPRTSSPTQAQIEAIIASADAAGHHGFALGLVMQWWLTLRAVDVRGQWLEGRWADGLTWDMISKDFTIITKTPSKTERSAPEAMIFDITPLENLRARLMAIPMDQRIGPVIKLESGQPFKRRYWAELFRTHARAAGVPDEVWGMDTRAGALNHAVGLGASPYDVRNQANHASLDTTDRYMRGRSESASRVIALRTGTMDKRP